MLIICVLSCIFGEVTYTPQKVTFFVELKVGIFLDHYDQCDLSEEVHPFGFPEYKYKNGNNFALIFNEILNK